MNKKPEDKCIGCGGEAKWHIKIIDKWTCTPCNPSIQTYLTAIQKQSQTFRKYTWERFFDKFNYGKKVKSKLL